LTDFYVCLHIVIMELFGEYLIFLFRDLTWADPRWRHPCPRSSLSLLSANQPRPIFPALGNSLTDVIVYSAHYPVASITSGAPACAHPAPRHAMMLIVTINNRGVRFVLSVRAPLLGNFFRKLIYPVASV
jgi:hypothetical protein